MEAQDSQGLKLLPKSEQIVTLVTLVPKRFGFYSHAFFFLLLIPSLFTACLACKLYFHGSIWEFYPVISVHNYQVSVSDDNLGLAVERQLLILSVCSSSGQALLGQNLRASCTVKAMVLFCSLQFAALCELCFK